MKNKKGFTFIETLVVIGIVAILATTVVVAINPTRRFEDARDKQREIHLQTILSAIERKTTIEAGWFDDDNCDSLPQATSTEVVDGKEVELPLFKIIGTATTTEDTYYDLFKCLVPKYMVNPLYDPDGGSENDTHYQIWQNPQTKYITLLYVSEKDPNKKIVAGAKKYGIAKIPTVETASITKITHISAEGGGNVTDDGGSSVFESGVVWDTHPNPTYSDNIGRTVDSSGITKFDSTITGLTSNTTYYVRAYARNDIGVGYGNEEPNVSFSTPDLRPVVETSLADNVTHETADLWGKILTLGEAPVTTYFCWGETENLVENCSGVNRISGEPGTINVPVSFSAFLGKDELIIDDLESKDYYFKACGHNNSGDRCGSIVKFTIQKGKPYVMTIYPATNITADSAVSWGEVVSDGGFDIEERGICYSNTRDPKYENWDDEYVFCDSVGGTTGEFSDSITGLEPNMTYNFRAYAKNGRGLSDGELKQFTTIKTAPRVTTKSATRGTSPGSGVSGGIIISDGGEPITQKGVCWAIYPSVPTKITTNCTNDGGGKNEFTSNIPITATGLWANTKYNVRAYAINKIETGWDVNYVTLDTTNPEVPKLTTIVPTDEEDIHTDSVENVGGDITDHGGAAIGRMGVCWSTTNEMPTVNDVYKDVIPNVNKGKFYTDITGLFADTFYYIRAYAQNIEGISYDENVGTFRTDTSDPPTLEDGTIVIETGESSAKIGGEVKSNGGDLGTIRGVCYSGTGNQNPTYEVRDGVNVICRDDGTTGVEGSFEITISGLSTGITYYALIFAHNNAGSAHGYPSVSFKVGRKLGETCTSTTQCNSGFCADGVCCDSVCSGSICQTCGTYSSNEIGHCGYVKDSSQDPRNECTTASPGQAGSCKSPTCSGTGYACGYLAAGEQSQSACKRCSGTSYDPVNIAGNTQDVEGSNLCNATCVKCSAGSCVNQSSGEDLFNHCTTASPGTAGSCRSPNCSGTGSSCGYLAVGEQSQPMCKRCSGTSYDPANIATFNDSEGSNTCTGTCASYCSGGNCVNTDTAFGTCRVSDNTRVTSGTGDGMCAGGTCIAGTRYYLYITYTNYNGNLGGRSGADAKCNTDANKPTAFCTRAGWAFISVNTTDKIIDFQNTGNIHKVATGLPWHWRYGNTSVIKAANNFSDLLDGSIINRAREIGYTSPYWTGSTASGALGSYHCSNWETYSATVYGNFGSPYYSDGGWLSYPNTAHYCGGSGYPILCACLGIE